VGPSDCQAAINLKLKEWFPHTQRYVKVRALKDFALKKPHTTWKPYKLHTKLGAMHNRRK